MLYFAAARRCFFNARFLCPAYAAFLVPRCAAATPALTPRIEADTLNRSNSAGKHAAYIPRASAAANAGLPRAGNRWRRNRASLAVRDSALSSFLCGIFAGGLAQLGERLHGMQEVK